MVKADLTQRERTVIYIHALLRENITDGAVVTRVEPAARHGFDQPVGLHSDRERERTHVSRDRQIVATRNSSPIGQYRIQDGRGTILWLLQGYRL